MKPDADRVASERWSSERAYFDAQAQVTRTTLAPFSDRVMERYGSRRRVHHSKEYRFRVMGDLHGRRILDVGCGDGTNAVIMARLGARVTGVDISDGAVTLARERAAVNGVSAETRFFCASLEEFTPPDAPFDVVWSDAFLHHVTPVLDDVLARLVGWVRPGGLLVAAEPVNLARWLRRLRLHISIVPVTGTPDERPLEHFELQAILTKYPWLAVRYFQLLGRVNRLVLRGRVLEEVTAFQRALVEGVARVDALLLRVPTPLQRMASTVVLYGVRPAAGVRTGA